jgi:hypothetical protein
VKGFPTFSSERTSKPKVVAMLDEVNKNVVSPIVLGDVLFR